MARIDLDALRLPITPLRRRTPVDLEALRLDPTDPRGCAEEDDAPCEDDVPWDLDDP